MKSFDSVTKNSQKLVMRAWSDPALRRKIEVISALVLFVNVVVFGSAFYFQLRSRPTLAATASDSEYRSQDNPNFSLDTGGLVVGDKQKSGLNKVTLDKGSIEAKILKGGKAQNIQAEITSPETGSDKFDIKLTGKNQFAPGKFTLQVIIKKSKTTVQKEAERIITQDFTWGVLAINPDKAVYKPGEDASLAMAVLDDKGNMDCGAKVSLVIVDPSGATQTFTADAKSIKVSDTCDSHEANLPPDFSASYKTSASGKYIMKLHAETKNGTHDIVDSFRVEEQPAFEITRTAPTRIYPLNKYTTKLTVKAREDFGGIITETVPSSFAVTPGEFTVQNSAEGKILTWNENLIAGEAKTLSYEWQAPIISPQFYLTGPLRFNGDAQSNTETIYEEPRQWQIAADATIDTYTSGSGSWQAPAGATSVQALVWGAGAGGSDSAGNGGGGGAFTQTTLSVTPGNSYTYSVGAGGWWDTNGGDSWFVSSATVLAKGGDLWGTGGQASACIPSGNAYSGGNGGGTGGNDWGGGGGGGAGSGGAGSQGVSGEPGTGGSGGSGTYPGGRGGDAMSSDGSIPGGGGGGYGSSGANGQILLIYTASTYTMSTSVASGSGSVSGAGTYNPGSTATVTANPSSRYGFSSWSGDCAGMGNPAYVTMNGNKSCSANFYLINTAPPISTPISPGNGTATRGDGTNQTFTTNAVSDANGDTVQYYFRVATGSDAETGTVCNSGWQTSTSYTCNPGQGTRYWHVYTYDGYAQTNPNYVWSFLFDTTAPVYNSTAFQNCNYVNGNNCYVKNGQTFYVLMNHSDALSGTNIQYLEFSKNGANRGTWDGATGNIKSSANPYGVPNGSYYTGFADGSGMTGAGYLDIQNAQCLQSGNCNSTAYGKWQVVAGSGASTGYGVTVYMYDQAWNGVGYTDTGKWVYLDNDAPTVPSGLTFTNLASTSLTINFTGSTDASSGLANPAYHIERAPDISGVPGTFTEIGTSNTTSYNDSSLTPNTKYWYRVRAVDNVGNYSGYSASASKYILSNAPASASATAISTTQIDVSWTAPTVGTFDHYLVYSSKDNYAASIYSSTGTSVSQTGLTSNTPYGYRVYTVNAEGTQSTAYAVASKYTLSVVPVLATPASPTINNKPSITNLTPSDSALSNATIRLYDSGALKASTTANSPLGDFTFITSSYVSVFSTGNHTNITARSVNGDGVESADSTAVTIVILDTTPPTVPTGLTFGTITSSSIALSWTASVDASGVAGYEIQRAPDSSGVPGTWANVSSGACSGVVPATSCTDSGLNPNTKYWYRLRGKDSGGNYSGYSGEMNVDTSAVGLWHFNEGTGTTVADSSGSGNTGTMSGTSYWTSGNGGKFGEGLNDSGDDYMYTTNSFSNPQAFTIEAWFKTTSPSGKKIIGFEDTQSGTGSASYDRQIYVGTDGKAYAGICGTTCPNVRASSSTVTDGNWHYAVLTMSSGTAIFYLDGSQQGTSISDNAQNFTGYWRVGGYKATGWTNGVDGYFNGQIDEVRISNVARSATDISNYYSEGSTNPKYATTLVLVSPTAPTNLAAGTITNSSVALSWTASVAGSNTIAGYEIQRAPDSAGVPGTWANVSSGACSGVVPATSCTDSGLSPNTKYWYRLRAKDSGGNYSGYSSGAGTVSSLTLTTAGFHAIGGTITRSDNYIVHNFTSNGTFAATGSTTGATLVVGGGGGGGAWYYGGGGGAGQFLYSSSTALSGNIGVTLGAAGAAGANGYAGGNGGNSVFGSITAYGGGGGAGEYAPGQNGANGGGAADGGGPGSGLYASTGQATGYRGGYKSYSWSGAGGGGAGGVGYDDPGDHYGGNGGAGLSSNITGTTLWYAGGGGGGAGNVYGTGGSGVGGNGGNAGYAATASTGSGGGAGSWGSGGAGADGIVIVRYAIGNITVTGLPAGYYVRLTDGTNNVDSAASSGTVTITPSVAQGVGPWTMRIYNGNPTSGGVQQGSDQTGVYGGDSWALTQPPLSVTTLTNAPVLDTPATPTNDNTPLITNTGTSDTSFANQQVNLYDNGTKVGQTNANASGVFSFGNNPITNPSFEIDANSNGMADNWNLWQNTLPVAPTYTMSTDSYTGLKAQRVQLSGGTATNGQGHVLYQQSSTDSFAPGQTAIFTIYLKGTTTGASVRLQIDSRTNAGGYIASAQSGALTLTGSWQKFTLTYPNLPATTQAVMGIINVYNYNTGNSLDFYADNAKISNYSSVLADGNHTNITATALNSGSVESANSSAKVVLVDTVNPVVGSVYDGTSGDQDWNDGSLNTLSANWTGFSDAGSGLQKYEYAIRRQSDGYYWNTSTNVWESTADWYNNALVTAKTVTPVYLQTSVAYYYSVRATDNAGNFVVASSNGQQVLPTFSFSISSNTLNFSNLNNANGYTDSQNVTLTTSTNANGGYTVYAYMPNPLTCPAFPANKIAGYVSPWTAPTTWSGYGFGYTTTDATIAGSTGFSGGKYARYVSSIPWSVVADNTSVVSGQTGAITNEQFTITNKVAVPTTQTALKYTGTVYYISTANY